MKTKLNFTRITIIAIFLFYFAGFAYSLDIRYSKLDENGNELSNDATEWSITYDSSTGLYWEVKSNSLGIHSKSDTYKYSKVKKGLIEILNDTKFGGFSDWRLPTVIELTQLKETKNEEPHINLEAFPNTMPSEYISWELCGNGEILPKKVVFGRQTTEKKRTYYVRAVRGTSPDGFDRY
nr:DUF1566 domain-containing protein [Desulfobulbaceae bacterium]